MLDFFELGNAVYQCLKKSILKDKQEKKYNSIKIIEQS